MTTCNSFLGEKKDNPRHHRRYTNYTPTRPDERTKFTCLSSAAVSKTIFKYKFLNEKKRKI